MHSREEDVCAPFNAERAAQIRQLNDAFRAGRGSGRLAITEGVLGLGRGAVVAILESIQRFDAFSPDNDPYGEHDFGAVDHAGQRVYWKIDYYDRDLRFGSPDPSDASVTLRVMTVMLASEY